MARRRFRSNQRHEPVTERSFQEYLYSSGAPQTSRTELMRLVRGGEDTFLELKVKLSNSERIAQEIVALANTAGGTIVFGVNDQMRVEGIDHPEQVQEELVRICREEIQPPIIPFVDRIAFDSGRRIVALDIEGKRRPYRTRDGRFFIRVGAEKREATPEELTALLDDSKPVSYETVPALGAGIADIDEAHLWSFVRTFEDGALKQAAARGYPTGEILERQLLLATTNGNDTVPTVAGLLLFGRDESVRQLLPRAALTVTRFGGDTNKAPIVERHELNGNLASIYESALRFVGRYCDMWDQPPQRISSSEENVPIAPRATYARAVISEAIANCLIHRDLALRDVPSRLHIFDRTIEIVNARRSAGFAPAALKAIRFGVPRRINPQIAAIFCSPAYGLSLPNVGLPGIFRSARTFTIRPPEIIAFNDEFRLRLYGV